MATRGRSNAKTENAAKPADKKAAAKTENAAKSADKKIAAKAEGDKAFTSAAGESTKADATPEKKKRSMGIRKYASACVFCGKTKEETGPYLFTFDNIDKHKICVCDNCATRVFRYTSFESRVIRKRERNERMGESSGGLDRRDPFDRSRDLSSNHMMNQFDEMPDDAPEDSEPEKAVTVDKKPSDYFSLLSEYVVGQDTAKRIIASAIYMHKMRLTNSDINMKKNNIMLVGPSGTGKTLIAETVAKMLDLPFAIMDATAVTQTGYVGQDVETVLKSLLASADGDMKKAEQGVVYIDEVDKLARRFASTTTNRDPVGEGVQQSLLKMIEGSRVDLNNSKRVASPLFMDTRNILFICGGAFEGMLTEKVSGGLGFNNELEDKVEAVEVTEETLVNYGMMPEFIGRFPIIARLNELTEEDFYRILAEPRDSVTEGYTRFFEKQGVKITFKEDGLREIAARAHERCTGARAMQGELELLLRDAVYDVPDDDTIKEIVVDSEAVGRGHAIYIRDDELQS